MKLLGQLCALLLISFYALADTNPVPLLTPPNTIDAETNVPTSNITLQQAHKLYKAQKFDEAAKLFNQVLAQNTNDFSTIWGLAYCYYSVSNYEDAAQAFRKYIKLKPQVSGGHRRLGLMLTHLGKFDEAEREIKEAIRLNATNVLAYDNLGYCLKSQHRYNEAATAFEKAIKLGGDTANYCFQAGVCYFHLDKYSTAIPLLQRSISVDTNGIYAYDWLGDCYYKTGNYEKAIATYTADLKIKPNRAYPLEWLGNSHLYQKNYKAACDAFAKASKLEPDDIELQRTYASMLLECNRAADAIRTLEPFQTSTNKSVRVTLFAAYLSHRDYEKAAKLYPATSTAVGILLALAFLGGSALLLRKSFLPSTIEHPHLAFAISWLVLYFEAQTALAFYAGIFSNSIVAGLLLAPVPLFVASFMAFPRQPWGKPFTPPVAIRWKQIGAAFLAWVGLTFIGGVFMTVLTHLTHYKPEPRNVRIVMEIVREHRALAALVVVLLGPIAEEILFRGLLFGALRKWLSANWTILVTAAIFAAIHLDPYYFVPLFLLGVLLGWARNTSNSIWFSTAIHIFQNALAFTALSLK